MGKERGTPHFSEAVLKIATELGLSKRDLHMAETCGGIDFSDWVEHVKRDTPSCDKGAGIKKERKK